VSARLPPDIDSSHSEDLGLLLREPFRLGSEELPRRIGERGHPNVRPPHGNVFGFLVDHVIAVD
jgi:hypothetical protein